MVPTLTCGLSRSNFSFATLGSLLVKSVWVRLAGRTSEIYLNRHARADSTARQGVSRRSGCLLASGTALDDLLGDVRRHLFVALEHHRVRGTPLRVGAQI